MPRQALGNSPRCRNNVDIYIAVVLAGERDLSSVRREIGASLYAGAGREPPGIAAFPAHDPEIAGVHERDLGRTQGRFLKERLRLGCSGGGNQDPYGEQKRATVHSELLTSGFVYCRRSGGS